MHAIIQSIWHVLKHSALDFKKTFLIPAKPLNIATLALFASQGRAPIRPATAKSAHSTHLILFFALLFGSLWSELCFALDTSSLPLIGDKFPFTLVVTGDKSIAPLLERELRKQRKYNRQLKQFLNADKVARFESNLLVQRLHAEGYYDADIAVKIDGKHITYLVNSAAQYLIQRIDIELPEGLSVPLQQLGVSEHQPLNAQKILTAQQLLRNYIADNYCLREINTDYNVVLNSAEHSASVQFSVKDSPSVNFGDIRFSGLTSIDEDYLIARLPIKKGQCFKLGQVDSARVKLIKSNLLANVTAAIGEAENGEVPITLKAVERQHRTVSAGLGYQSDNGPNISLGWEHRNLYHRAQRLKLSSQFGEVQQQLKLDFTLPHFRRNNQQITLYSEITRENTEAFLSNTTELGAEISRPLWQKLLLSLGSKMEFSKVEDPQKIESFALFSFPLGLEYDRRNDPLNPTKGWVASTRFRPYWNAYQETRFLKSTLAISAYHTFAKLPWQPTLALRTAQGTIDGAERVDVAPNLRFYVGGGGSVRGYPFQSLGPFKEQTPVGGLSFSDYSMEARLRWNQNWGAVAFLDGGFAYQDRSPRVGEDIHWGAGLGLRFFTSFAPIRFDIALPLNRRQGIDDAFQVYISLGQAF